MKSNQSDVKSADSSTKSTIPPASGSSGKDPKYGPNQRFWTPPRFSWLWFEFWASRIFRVISQRSTLQLVALAFVLHFVLSILMLYVHLVYYSESPFSKHAAEHFHPDRGRVAIQSRRPSVNDIDYEMKYKLRNVDFKNETIFGPEKSINLLTSRLLNSGDLSHIGWFSDHYRWETHVQCFNSRWALCDTVYSAKCKLETIRAIYQYVPFKHDPAVHELFFNVRANAEELLEQDTNAAFFGLLALITTADQKVEIVRLSFQPEIDNWSVRSHHHKSRQPISSVVIMLTCLGYGGSVSFSDLRLSIPNTPNDPIHSMEKILSRCDEKKVARRDEEEKRALKFEVLEFDEQHEKSEKDKRDCSVSFVTQVSIDRLGVLEYSLQTWSSGALSIVIHVPIESSNEGIKDWQRLYIKKKIANLNISLRESSILLASSLTTEDYPINSLRNLAIEHAKTEYLLLLDADFQPSPGLVANFDADIVRRFAGVPNSVGDRIAFVVPAFGYIEMPKKEDPIVGSKEELLELIHREDAIIEPFRLHESSDAHKLTNYWHWYHSTDIYNITASFHDKYEPYIIVKKTDTLPRYSELFANYGMNKVMHITELFAARYSFKVLHNCWAIHTPHRSSKYYQDFMQNLDQRLTNRAQRFRILERIIAQYNITLPQCLGAVKGASDKSD